MTIKIHTNAAWVLKVFNKHILYDYQCVVNDNTSPSFVML